jgi:hypothetical protein
MWNLRLRRARWREWRLAQLRFFRPGFLLIATLAAGCARSPKHGDRAGGFEAITAPVPPPFLSGPMALLLTNAEGFRAQVVLASGTAPHSAPLAAGELMGRGGKLLFGPAVTKAARKKAPAVDSAFIWDVVENRGWMLNDPIQGYAPIASRQSYTNLIAGAILLSAAPERIAGHRCQEAEVTVTASDGTATAFRVWRAEDLNGLPLRITGIANGAPITLAFSAIRREQVPEDLFQPPNGFTKYDSPEAMMTELALRKVNLGRKPAFEVPESEPGAGLNTPAPRRTY